MDRQEIYKIIDKERDYQNARWGHENDKTYTLDGWNHLIGNYAREADHHLFNKDPDAYMRTMRKLAAITIAMFEHQGVPERV